MSGAVYSHDGRDDTATPKCGAHKDLAVHKNALLVQPQLGHVKHTVYDLPSKGNFQHSYGLMQERDGSSSAEVLGNWAQSEPNPNVVPGRDFKALNKHAVVGGITSCKGMADYRSTHDFRLKLGSDKTVVKMPYDATTSFGRPTNAGGNFQDLFSHAYRHDWVANAPSAQEFLEKKKPMKPKMTKSAIALAAAAQSKLTEGEAQKLWKMKNFDGIPPKIGPKG